MIPPQLQPAGFRFIKLRKGDKIPIEKDWQNTNNYAFDDQALINHFSSGGNYGVACGFSGLVVLDVDDVKRFKSHADHKKLPPTFTVKTGSGGFHFYFVCEDLDRKIVLEDSTGHHLGEIQSTGAQVVGPGCLHPNGNRYEVVNDVPIAPISKEDLLKALNFDQLEEIERQARRRRKPTTDDDPFENVSILDVIDTTGFEQCGSQLKGPHPVHGSKGGVNLVVNPSRNLWWCARHETGGGVPLWIAVEAGLIDCSEARPGALRGKLYVKVLEIAQQKGLIEGKKHVTIDYKSVVKDKKNSKDEVIGEKFSPSKAAKTVLRNFDVLTTRGARAKDPLTTWIYDEESGLFVPDGEFRIKAALNHVAGDMFTLRMASETIAKIQYESICDLDELDGDPYLFPVENKVVDLRTGAVMDYSPELKLTAKSPIKYDPKAKCPTILNFLSESLADSRDVLSIIDLFVAMSIRLPFDLFVILLGQGSNGKLVLENLIEAFFGSDQVTAVRLESLGKNQFSAGELIGKRALINSEVSGSAKESDWMKRIASGDPIDTDVKHAGHILFRPHCLQIFDCNNPPQFHDNSFGLARRLGKFDFPFKFVDNPDQTNAYEKKKDPKLKVKTTTDEELSGLLNLIIARAPSLIESGEVYLRVGGVEAATEYSHQARNMESFVNECCEVDEHDYAMHSGAAELYETYEQYCETWNISPVTENSFGRHITKVTGKKSTTENGIRYRHYICIKENAIKNRLQQIITDSEQDKQYQEQIKQISNLYFKDVVNRFFTSNVENLEIFSLWKKNPEKSVKSVKSVPDSDYSVHDLLYSVWNLFELGGRLEEEGSPNIGKIEMATPTWRDEIRRVTKKHGGRVTADDLIRECGWKPEVVRRRLGYLHEKEGWTSEKLVSGLLIFREPTEVA